MRSTEDSTRDRILRAALARFARDGLGAPLRTIASDAGVSAPLVLHHFGSRAGLRQACDAEIADVARNNKSSVLNPFTAVSTVLDQGERVGQYAVEIGYVLRLLQAGDAASADFVRRLCADAEEYLAVGVAHGTVRPSREPVERARLLTRMALGSLLLELPGRDEPMELDQLPAWLEAYYARMVVPLLELYTEGLLTDSTLLDAVLAAGSAADATERT